MLSHRNLLAMVDAVLLDINPAVPTELCERYWTGQTRRV
jgi:hypothetical protein